MTRQLTDVKKSTNVRFFVAATAALLVTGCGTVAPLSSELQSARTPGPAVCENFGPETRCSYSDSSRITRELDRLNRSARVGYGF